MCRRLRFVEPPDLIATRVAVGGKFTSSDLVEKRSIRLVERDLAHPRNAGRPWQRGPEHLKAQVSDGSEQRNCHRAGICGEEQGEQREAEDRFELDGQSEAILGFTLL